MTIETFDLRGLKCPLPALMARRALERCAPGAAIEVIADDPLAPLDVPHMCRQEGFEFVDLAREGSASRMTLRRPMTWAPRAADPGERERLAP
jgi:tRNA 2-thiouridine synthesizing protein A